MAWLLSHSCKGKWITYFELGKVCGHEPLLNNFLFEKNEDASLNIEKLLMPSFVKHNVSFKTLVRYYISVSLISAIFFGVIMILSFQAVN